MVTIGGLGTPFVVGGVWVIAHDAYLTALGYGFLVPLYLHGGYHGLTGIAETTGGTMVEDVPLTVDFLQRTVGIVPPVGGSESTAVLVEDYAAAIYEHTARTPGTQGRVTVGIAEGGVGAAQAIVGTGVAGEDHDVLVADLTDGRGLEEVELTGILSLVEGGIFRTLRVSHLTVTAGGGDEIVVYLGAGTHAVHGVLVKFGRGGVLETVEDIGTEALVEVLVLLVRDGLYKDGGVKVNHAALYTLALVGREVDGGEGTVGTVALAHHGHAAPTARVGIEVVGLLAGGLVLDLH